MVVSSSQSGVLICSTQTNNAILVLSNGSSFSLSLIFPKNYVKNSNPPQHFISKESEEYSIFEKFFYECRIKTKSSILIDDKTDIENAPIIMYSKNSKGIVLTFYTSNNEYTINQAYSDSRTPYLASAYSHLYADLDKLKKQKNTIKITEQGMSL